MGRARKKGQNITGWLVLDKPLGLSSTQALGKARWLLNAKKAGHAGTLDPLATGVLPLAFGEATKTISFMMEAQKTYEFTIRWGQSTTTLDSEGEVVANSGMRPERAAIEAALSEFIGDIEQIPPAFSAIKVDGKRAYTLARAGKDVVLKSRNVRIDALTLLAMPDADHAVFMVECGKGTYVRSLMRDLAMALGTEGHVVHLRRTQVGPFKAANAISLTTLEALAAKDEAMNTLAPLAVSLAHLPALSISVAETEDVRHGRTVPLGAGRAFDDKAMIYTHFEGEPVAIGMKDGVYFKPVRVFNRH